MEPTAQLCQDPATVVGSAPVDVGPLFGRDAETGLLESLIDATPERGAALSLRGEPGIGKSRLLMHAASLAHERGMTVLSIAGVQAEAQLPFAGLHQLLRPVRDRALDLLPEHRATLDAAFGLGSQEPPSHWHCDGRARPALRRRDGRSGARSRR